MKLDELKDYDYVSMKVYGRIKKNTAGETIFQHIESAPDLEYLCEGMIVILKEKHKWLNEELLTRKKEGGNPQ